MHGKRAIAAVSLAIGLLFAGSLGCAPDTIEDDDVLLPAIDLSLFETGSDALPSRAPETTPYRWFERASSTGREHSAVIFHPPI